MIVYAVITRFIMKPGGAEAVRPILRNQILPALAQLPHFRHFYAARTGEDIATAVTLWDSEEGLEVHLQQFTELATRTAGAHIISMERESGEVMFELGS
ncbi:MAG: antibiotic biosynthesis monooxygenase [Chloroflexota bacterium]